MKKIQNTIIVILVIALGAGAFYIYKNMTPVTKSALQVKLEDSSELTSQKMVYQDVYEDQSGKIPLIAKDKYLLKYTAVIRAGIDVKEVKVVDLTDSKVVIELPHAKILDVSVPPDKLEFISTGFSIIKADKNSLAASQTEAKKHAEKYAAANEDFISAADANTEILIRGLLSGAIGNREIEFRYIDQED